MNEPPEKLPEPLREILKGGSVPSVNPEDLKRAWEYYREAQRRAKGSVAIGFAILRGIG